MNILVTGGAGFIGSHLGERLVRDGHTVWAVDNFDPFYDPGVKERNVAWLLTRPEFHLVRADIRDRAALSVALGGPNAPQFDVIVHLAARAGVRPSLEEPLLYSQVNIDGTVVMLELARELGVKRFIFGSSSSVYGNNEKVPFSEEDPVDGPISPYAATKRAGELICHTYHHLYDLSIVCLRFFTVYGPRQRPDLAIHKFTSLITRGEPVPVFGDGSTERDYTYVDDIVAGVLGSIRYTEGPAVFEIVNLGGSRTTSLTRLIELLTEATGMPARIDRRPMQPGDVLRTYADVSRANRLFGYDPTVAIEDGIRKFVEWYRAESDARQAPSGRRAALRIAR